ncbi:MAG: 1-deoxy-D-xylulose-5-phosphate synthase [Firmicutes bacterium]|nr:1-deoxy-D-xylulose-5-phosphate synthase [Bacillota bacterium]
MDRILDRIEGPHSLKSLDYSSLERLAEELRREIIETVALTGGHLAPNLGVVELTLALHLVFESPKDRIVWDVGHQCYVHKLLTGRLDRFRTLRQYRGISGFPSPRESEHDAFVTGHSSTSISAGLGMAKARDIKGEDYAVVCVIGDASLSGGLAFEALNHAGHLKSNLVVVLNDNEMSISANVGALSSYLSRVRLDPRVLRIKEDIEYLIRRIPAIGSTMSDAVNRLKGSIKYLVVPALFEELGFTYVGPINGHDIAAVCRALSDARRKGGPVLVHVVTTKGKGCPFAESNPSFYHGVDPYDPETGEPVSTGPGYPPTFTQAFGESLVELGRECDRIVAITAAMAKGTGLEAFAAEYPYRFFDVGIAEEHAVTFAAGLAKAGMRPVVAVYSTFLQRSYDQIVHDVCIQELPVVFAVDRAGIVGEDGQTHHGMFDVTFLRHIPNMIVLAPRDHRELSAMLRFALSCNGPVAIRYPKGTSPVPLPWERSPVVLGRAETVVRGSDVAVIALGSMVAVAEETAKLLEQQGISCWIVDARFAAPIDDRIVTEIAMNRLPIVTLEENCVEGGMGSAVSQVVADLPLASRVRVVNLGLPKAFVQHGSRTQLLNELCLNPECLAQRIGVIVKEARSERQRASVLRVGSAARSEGERVGPRTP